MTLLGANGFPIGKRITSDYFHDDFERGEPDVITDLGNGWVDLTESMPTSYDSVGIMNGYVTTKANSRSAAASLPYAPNPGTTGNDYLNHPGTILPGIGGAFQSMGTSDVYVEIRYGGFLNYPEHSEATPGVCFVPGSPEGGFGVWIIRYGGAWVAAAGWVGNPCESFVVIDAVPVPIQDEEQPLIGILTSNGGTEARIFYNRRQLSMTTAGTNPLDIPENLHGSTNHGMLIDQHMCYPSGQPLSLSFMQDAACIHDIKMFTR